MRESIPVVPKKIEVRRLSSLGGVRRVLARLYEEARRADTEKVSYYRMLANILGTIATVLKDERLEDFEARLDALEQVNREVRNGEY